MVGGWWLTSDGGGWTVDGGRWTAGGWRVCEGKCFPIFHSTGPILFLKITNPNHQSPITKSGESAGKPDSVPSKGDGHPSGACVTVRPRCGPPEAWSADHRRLCSTLLREGFTSHPGRPECWWSLTPPFHPCLCWRMSVRHTRHPAIGGLVSAALSVGSPRLGVTQLPVLWSPDFPRSSMTTAAVWRTRQPEG